MTAVEYALIVALLVVPSIGALARLDDASGDYYENASDDIGDLPQLGIDTSGSDTSVPSGGSTSTTTPATTAPPGSTTTTAAPTTTAPSTTTTAPPTTTTAAPTTTTTLLQSTISQLVDISRDNGNRFRAIARVKIERTSNGSAVSGAAVTIRLVDRFGDTKIRSCNTDSTGRCSVNWTVKDNDGPVTATVTNVTANPPWDGQQQSVTLETIW